MGTWLQAHGGAVRTLAPRDSWTRIDAVVVGNVDDADVTPAALRRVKEYLASGGSVLIALPDLLDPFPRDSTEGRRQYWMHQDGECDWEVAKRRARWDPTALYEKRLLPCARLCAALGVLPHPCRVTNYHRIHGGWCWSDLFFDRKPGFEDFSGGRLVEPHGPLMIDSFLLEPLADTMQPLLQLNGKPVLVGGRWGKGCLFVAGGPDMFRNRAVSEKLHEPREWNQPALPRPAANIEVRNSLFQALLAGSPSPASVAPRVPQSTLDVTLERLPEELHVAWRGADDRPHHFTIRDCPQAGTTGVIPRVHLGVDDQQRLVELRAVPHVLHRARTELEVRHGEHLQIVLRDEHEFSPGTCDVFEQYTFTFLPGRDYFLIDYRLEPLHVSRPFGRGALELRPVEDSSGWRKTADARQTWQILSDGKTGFGWAAVQGGAWSGTHSGQTPSEYRVAVCACRDAEASLDTIRRANWTDLFQVGSAPHPLARRVQEARKTFNTAWRSRVREPDWVPGDSDIRTGWMLQQAAEALDGCEPEKAAELFSGAKMGCEDSR